jgi:integrase
LILETLLAVKAKGLEEMAKRCRTYISQIYQHAIVRGWADRDPAKDLERLPELKRSTPPAHHRAVKNPTELARLLVDMEGIKSTIIGAALWLSPYVFLRASELAGARWEEIDFQDSLWRLPQERMKANRPHFVPLALQVKAHLEALHKLTGFGPVVFPGHKRGQAPINADSLRMALNRLGYGRGSLINHTHHGFRSVAGTFLRENGYNGNWIEAQLAHGKSNKVQAAYDFAEYLPQRREMMQSWADFIDGLRASGGTAVHENAPDKAALDRILADG